VLTPRARVTTYRAMLMENQIRKDRITK